VLAELDDIIAVYTSLDESFKKFVDILQHEYVSEVDSSQQYVLLSRYFKDGSDAFKGTLLDKLLIDVKSWLDGVLCSFDKSADEQISNVIPKVPSFIEEMDIL